MSWRDLITIGTEQCGGRPCIRGMRIRVIDVLDLLAAGLSHDEILEELPDLDVEDVEAAILYARSRIDSELPRDKLDNLTRRDCLVGDPEEIVHMVWLQERGP